MRQRRHELNPPTTFRQLCRALHDHKGSKSAVFNVQYLSKAMLETSEDVYLAFNQHIGLKNKKFKILVHLTFNGTVRQRKPKFQTSAGPRASSPDVELLQKPSGLLTNYQFKTERCHSIKIAVKLHVSGFEFQGEKKSVLHLSGKNSDVVCQQLFSVTRIRFPSRKI